MIIKGAPPHLKMSIACPLQGCQTIAQAITFFEECRELDQDKAISFAIQKKPQKQNSKPRFFQNIRPLGDNRPKMNIRQQGNRTFNPVRKIIGRQMKTP